MQNTEHERKKKKKLYPKINCI
uniref:Uncharacterized protein n=1 Tax=Anguilla anguilla TaxID=7936 RepID=A0A0E9TEE9_ANGAN